VSPSSLLLCDPVCCSVLQCVAVRAVVGERVPRGPSRLRVHTITVTHTGSTYCCAEQISSLWLVVSGSSTKTACSISLYVDNMILLTKRAWSTRPFYTYVCMYVCMYACMYVCMYVFMYVCMYIYLFVCMFV